jgi:hypothetical protein
LQELLAMRRNYEDKSTLTKYGFFTCRIVALAAASLSAVLPGLTQNPWAASYAALLVLLATGIEGIFRYQEQWIGFRTTAVNLKQEEWLYCAKAGVYAGISPEAREKLLAERMVELLSGESRRWGETMSKLPAGSDKPASAP